MFFIVQIFQETHMCSASLYGNFCAIFYRKILENIGRIYVTPLSKVWLSLRWFKKNTFLRWCHVEIQCAHFLPNLSRNVDITNRRSFIAVIKNATHWADFQESDSRSTPFRKQMDYEVSCKFKEPFVTDTRSRTDGQTDVVSTYGFICYFANNA